MAAKWFTKVSPEDTAMFRLAKRTYYAYARRSRV
jgi:hypothetical protein